MDMVAVSSSQRPYTRSRRSAARTRSRHEGRTLCVETAARCASGPGLSGLQLEHVPELGLGPVVAVLAARPPCASSLNSSAIASTNVDFPDPFSPTSMVTGAVKVDHARQARPHTAPCTAKYRKTLGAAALGEVGTPDEHQPSYRPSSSGTQPPADRQIPVGLRAGLRHAATP